MKFKIQKRFYYYLALLVLNIIGVIAVFKEIEPKNKAALFAGTLFVLVSLLVMWGQWQAQRALRTPSFIFAAVLLFIFSIPMLAVRASNYEIPFAELRVWGLPGPVFHGLSNLAYMALIAGVIIDAWQSRQSNG